MVGKFDNVKVLTCDERKNKSGEVYYIYNLLSNNRIYNMYSKNFYNVVPEDEVSILIELSTYNGNYNCKLVGVE